jgi:hypothetical protein
MNAAATLRRIQYSINFTSLYDFVISNAYTQ